MTNEFTSSHSAMMNLQAHILHVNICIISQLFRVLTLDMRVNQIITWFRYDEPMNRNKPRTERTCFIAALLCTHIVVECWQRQQRRRLMSQNNHQRRTCAVHELFNKNVHAFLFGFHSIRAGSRCNGAAARNEPTDECLFGPKTN